MKYFLLSFLVMSVFLNPVMAQENADDVLAETQENFQEQIETPIKEIPKEENYEKRLELAKQMHEIWPVRPKVESAIDAVAEQAPEAERAKFKAAMRRAMKFQALEEKSIETMAEIFTIAELEKMIEFYGSKEGRSVSYKSGDYEAALQPLMIEMIDKALLDTRLGVQ